jgi:hypothetical protein
MHIRIYDGADPLQILKFDAGDLVIKVAKLGLIHQKLNLSLVPGNSFFV